MIIGSNYFSVDPNEIFNVSVTGAGIMWFLIYFWDKNSCVAQAAIELTISCITHLSAYIPEATIHTPLLLIYIYKGHLFSSLRVNNLDDWKYNDWSDSSYFYVSTEFVYMLYCKIKARERTYMLMLVSK